MGGESGRQGKGDNTLYNKIRAAIEALVTDRQYKIIYSDEPKHDPEKTERYTFISSISSCSDRPKLQLRKYLRKQGAGLLEQVAAEFGVILGKELQKLAAFGRDYWCGLSECGITWEDAEKFVSETYGCLPELGQTVELDDLTLCKVDKAVWEKATVVALRPEKNSENKKDGYEDCRKRGEKLPVKPVLMLGYDNADYVEKTKKITKTVRIAYVGSPRYLDYFSELFVSDYWRSRCCMTLRLGKHLLHFEAELDQKESSPDTVNRLVSDILSTVLISGRPLRYYTATFYFPVDLHDAVFKEDQEGPREIPDEAEQQKIFTQAFAAEGSEEFKNYRNYSESEIDAQAVRYFSPLLRKQIFKIEGEVSNINPIREYRMEPESEATLCLQYCKGKSISAQVENISLYCHHHEMGLLAIRVTMPLSGASWDNCEEADRISWWHDIFDSSQSAKSSQMENWLTFTHHARILYPSFLEQWDEEKIAELEYREEDRNLDTHFRQCKNNSIVEGLLRRVLVRFTKNPDDLLDTVWTNIRDDRMFVNVAYALSGPIPGNQWAKAEHRRLFSLAQHVDRQCDASPEGFACSAEFVTACADRQVYARWEEFGSLYGFTDHSHVYMGVGRKMREHIAPVHVPHLYGRLTVLNLLYKNIFHYYEHEIGIHSPTKPELKDKKAKDAKADNGKFRDFRDRFTDFSNRYWFHEVTEQQQGKEIYTMQAREMGLEKHHDIIRDEIESTEQYQQDKVRDRITLLGVTFTLLAVVVGILSIDNISTKLVEPIGNLLVEPLARMLVGLFVQASKNPAWCTSVNVDALVGYMDFWLYISIAMFFIMVLLHFLARGMSMAKTGTTGTIFALAVWVFLPVGFLFFTDWLSVSHNFSLDVDTVLLLLTVSLLIIMLVLLVRFYRPFLQYRSIGKSHAPQGNFRSWLRHISRQCPPGKRHDR